MTTEAEKTTSEEKNASPPSSDNSGNLPYDILDYLITCREDTENKEDDSNDQCDFIHQEDAKGKVGDNIILEGSDCSGVTTDQIKPALTANRTETKSETTTQLSHLLSSSVQKILPPVSLGHRTDHLVRTLQADPGAYGVQPQEGMFTRTESWSSNISSQMERGLEDRQALATVAVAELVDEGETISAREEIDRLKRELQQLKQESLRAAEVFVAEPIPAQQPARRMKYYKDDVPKTLFGERMVYRSSHDCSKKPKADSKSATLRFDSIEQLFGRDAQLQQLKGAFQNFVPESGEAPKKQLVLISGQSGSGKSALAQKTNELFMKNHKAKEGFYITGKFNELATSANSAPCSAIAEACEMLCRELVLKMQPKSTVDANQFKDLPLRIREVLDPEDTYLLKTIMPSLQKIVGEDTYGCGQQKWCLEDRRRFQHSFQSFIRLISSMFPLVLVIEDLQWIDQASVDLIECVVTDKGGEASIMLVLTYRDNEVDQNHLFPKAISGLKEQLAADRHFDITEITVQDLNEADVCSFLQRLLCYEKEEAQPLAECIHNKTGGNPFYVKQFLLSLQADRLVTFNPDLQRWQCNVREIRSAARATDNIGALLSQKLLKLPSMIRDILLRVACLGSPFTTAAAQIVLQGYLDETGAGHTDSVVGILKTCQREGLLVDYGQATWSWEHDSVKEAALLLMSDRERLDAIKYEMGELLLAKLPVEELASSHDTFVAANLLNSRACFLPGKHPKRIEIAVINLRAAKASFRSSAFQAAAQYLNYGIALLPPGNVKWEGHFDLSLDLYAGAAEAQYCIGEHPKVKELCDEVVALSCCPLFKQRRAYNVLIPL